MKKLYLFLVTLLIVFTASAQTIKRAQINNRDVTVSLALQKDSQCDTYLKGLLEINNDFRGHITVVVTYSWRESTNQGYVMMTDNIKIFDSNVYSYKGYGYSHELKVQTFIPCNSIGWKRRVRLTPSGTRD
jgi:hypothetical protein